MTLDKIDMNTDTEQIQKLPEQLTRVGNQYRLFKRGEKALIYGEGHDGLNLAFEVFKIRTYAAGERFGKQYPEREVFPPSEAFGKWAGWCNTEEKALRFFQLLEKGEKLGHRGIR